MNGIFGNFEDSFASDITWYGDLLRVNGMNSIFGNFEDSFASDITRGFVKSKWYER